jgi:hypothetical protein
MRAASTAVIAKSLSTTDPANPLSGHLKWKMAERERLAKLGFNLDGTPMNPSDGNERK